jgi:hypothetical protein
MEVQELIQPAIFSFADSDNPADMLQGAAYVTSFVKELSAHFIESDTASGLSAAGINGLFLILQGIEDTIRTAAEKL